MPPPKRNTQPRVESVASSSAPDELDQVFLLAKELWGEEAAHRAMNEPTQVESLKRVLPKVQLPVRK